MSAPVIAPVIGWADPTTLNTIPQSGFNRTFTTAAAAAMVSSVYAAYGDPSGGTSLKAGIVDLTLLTADGSIGDLPNIYTGEPPSVIYIKSISSPGQPLRAYVYSLAPIAASECYIYAHFGFNPATAPFYEVPNYGTMTLWAIVNGALTSNALSLTYDANGWTLSDKAVPLATDLSAAYTAFRSSASGSAVIPPAQNVLSLSVGMNAANPYVVYFPQSFSYGWFPDAGSKRLSPVLDASFMYGSYNIQLLDDGTHSGSGTVRIHAAVANGFSSTSLQYLVPNELFIRVDDKGPGQLTATWGSRPIPPYVGAGLPPYVPQWENFHLTFEHR